MNHVVDWHKEKTARDERLKAGGKFAQGKMVKPEDATALLEAVIRPGNRLCMEGDNQKQADFLAGALTKADPKKLHDLHIVQSGLVLPEHFDLFERGIAKKLDYSYSGTEGGAVARALNDGKIEFGAVHTYIKLTQRWARRGTRPCAPQDQRTASTYIFGAICPKEGKAAALVLPWCNIEAMALHLAAISQKIEPGRHAALLLDQAGWHVSAKLRVPEPRKSRCDFADITIVPLPAKCPEPNPQENVWQFMRDNWLSNRVFTSHDNLVDHCCAAWNRLVDAPWTIMSLGLRDWAHEF